MQGAWAQSPAAPVEQVARPRIGLVLGGGGARGLAHLAVLRELERLRIPVSCIAGTSAGALVGGIYATGRPLDEVIARIRDADWDALLVGQPDRGSLPYSAKVNDDRNLATPTFGFDAAGVHLPRSAVGSQRIDRFLRELVGDVYQRSFDDLAIPFRAVATDLISGGAKVFDSGDLTTAMRASMAVPGVFDIVDVDDQSYVDGMFVRNLPVQDVKGCADVVIAVDVGMPSLKRSDVHSLLDVISQTMSITTRQNIEAQRALLNARDIVIQPDLTGFTPASFREAPQIIERASHLSAATEQRLAALSLSPADYAAWREGLRRHYVASQQQTFDSVRVAATRVVPPAAVRAVIDSPQPPRNREELQQRVDELFASGEYDSVSYSLKEVDGQRVATVEPVERSVGPNHLRLGLEMQFDTRRGSDFALLASPLLTRLNRWGAQWRSDLRLGNNSALDTEFFQPIPHTQAFIAPHAEIGWQDLPFYDAAGRRRLEVVTTRRSMFGLDVGYSLGSYGELRFGPYIRHAAWLVGLGDDASSRASGAQASLTLDKLDDPRFPRRGYYASANYRAGRSITTGQDWTVSKEVRLALDGATTFGNTTWRLTLGHDQVDEDDSTEFFQLGGFLNLSGLRTHQLLGTKRSFGRLMVYRQIAPVLPNLGTGTYLGGSLEIGRMGGGPFEDSNKPIPSASVWLAVDTFLGPIYTGLGWSNFYGGQIAGYIYLGNAR